MQLRDIYRRGRSREKMAKGKRKVGKKNVGKKGKATAGSVRTSLALPASKLSRTLPAAADSASKSSASSVLEHTNRGWPPLEAGHRFRRLSGDKAVASRSNSTRPPVAEGRPPRIALSAHPPGERRTQLAAVSGSSARPRVPLSLPAASGGSIDGRRMAGAGAKAALVAAVEAAVGSGSGGDRAPIATSLIARERGGGKEGGRVGGERGQLVNLVPSRPASGNLASSRPESGNRAPPMPQSRPVSGAPTRGLDTIEHFLIRAAELLINADYVLIAAGAGFSADSGLPVYKDIADVEAYKRLNLTYADLCTPDWLQRDPEMFFGFWGSCFNDYMQTAPHNGYKLCKHWSDTHFDASTSAAAREESQQDVDASTRGHRGVDGVVGRLKSLSISCPSRAGGAAAFRRPMSRETAGVVGGVTGAGDRGRRRGGGGYVAAQKKTQVFVYTSNVDTAFERAGFLPQNFLEIHGNVCDWQVSLSIAWCNTLHHTAPHCNALQRTATHCNTLHYIATYCNTVQPVQHTTTPCNTLK